MAAMASSSRAPALPPRQSSSVNSPYSDAPPPYSSIAYQQEMSGKDPWASQDPRTSSTQSLVPSESNVQNERRRLLLLFIHGFMGDETSFRSFPAHVHKLLTVVLAETHVVHTKIYPRYRSKRNISFARDDFSKWLEPHEAAKTDVILLGHSMGGLLSAEVALMPSSSPASATPLKHRILGTINFDVPFLGMSPHVVKSGLSSIFHSADYQDKWSPNLTPTTSNDLGSMSSVSSLGQSGRTDTLWEPGNPDPNFNQRFANDVALPVRKGWKNAWHFVHKHSKNLNELSKATSSLLTSHMEFGGAMANYPELRTRYARIRALEDSNESVRRSGVQVGTPPPRVRFINYYTVSTGRVKKAKSPNRSPSMSAAQSQTSLSPSAAEESSRGRRNHETARPSSMRSLSPRISVEEYSNDGIVPKEPEIPSSEDEDWEEAAESLTIGDSSVDANPAISTGSSLPPIPDLPPRPPPLDLSYIQDPQTRKLVEMEHARAIEAYNRAAKDRQKAIQDQDKFLEEQARKRDKVGSKLESKPQDSNEAAASASTPSTSVPDDQPPTPPLLTPSRSASPGADGTKSKPPSEHNFCALPQKYSNGERDPTWVRVFMEDVDEVGAHCGLFFVDERYERLVGDVADRVEQWLNEDAGERYFADSKR